MPKIVKKTMQMNQEYIGRLQEVFGVRTEKGAVNITMEMALVDDEIIKAHKHVPPCLHGALHRGAPVYGRQGSF